MNATLDDMTLPEEMIWLDEAKWTAVAQSTEYTLNGALIVQQGVKQAGRQMSLGGDNCWARWSLVKQLQETTHVADKRMTLTLEDGRSYLVIWDHENDPIEITRIYERQPQDDDWCRMTLHFIIVGEN